MSSHVYLNGEFIPETEAKISVFDRGFLFADSLYELIPFYDGVGFRLEEHLQRLHQGLKAARIQCDEDIAALCQQLLEINGGGHQAVYIQITRGVDERRRHRINPGLKPTVFLLSYPIKPALIGDLSHYEGISAITCEDIRWRRCDIKSNALLANILAVQEALDQGAQEALFVRDGHLLEGASSNLFMVRNGKLYTSPSDEQILGGTTRSVILELARLLGLALTIQELPEHWLSEADELWITGSTRGVVPVVKVNDQTIGDGHPGPIWLRMATAFRQFQQQLLQK